MFYGHKSFNYAKQQHWLMLLLIGIVSTDLPITHIDVRITPQRARSLHMREHSVTCLGRMSYHAF